jgi:hypothetical protein
VKYHEVAHYYWFEKLTEKERESYKKLYSKTKTYFRDYSSTSAEEDFADAFGTAYAKVSIGKMNPELKKRQRLALKLISKYSKHDNKISK